MDCAAIVVSPVDASPVRSPQAVHSTLAPWFRGKEIVEIGTRNGDGLLCFAQFATAATAVEMDEHYCMRLRSRGKPAGPGRRGFNVSCSRYQSGTPDADVYTWWQQSPHLSNEEVLAHLCVEQQRGQVRASAWSAILFDHYRNWLGVIENNFP